MSTKYHQLSLKDTFSGCQDMFMDDVPSFFQLLDKHLELDGFIPADFSSAFYHSLGRKRIYPLDGFLSALILQKIFSIPTDSLLILFLNLCKELREFCGFQKVPDAPCLHVPNRTSFLLLKICSISLSILPIPSVRPSMLPWPRCSRLILPALSSMSPKITLRPSIHSSAY